MFQPLDEIIEAINSQNNNKSPGNDGLTAEFYEHFSSDIVPMLLDVYNSWTELFHYFSHLPKSR